MNTITSVVSPDGTTVGRTALRHPRLPERPDLWDRLHTEALTAYRERRQCLAINLVTERHTDILHLLEQGAEPVEALQAAVLGLQTARAHTGMPVAYIGYAMITAFPTVAELIASMLSPEEFLESEGVVATTLLWRGGGRVMLSQPVGDGLFRDTDVQLSQVPWGHWFTLIEEK